MKIETYEKASEIYKKIRNIEYYIRCIDENDVCLCKYGYEDYKHFMDLDEEMKEFIKDRLVSAKDSYYKELSEL